MPTKSSRNARKNKASNISRQSSLPSSIEPSPLPSAPNSPAQRQLPTPLPELEIEEEAIYNIHKRTVDPHEDYRSTTHNVTSDKDRIRSSRGWNRGRNSLDDMPPTIDIKSELAIYDEDVFPAAALGSSPSPLIDFGGAVLPALDNVKVDTHKPLDIPTHHHHSVYGYGDADTYSLDSGPASYKSPPFIQAELSDEEDERRDETSPSPLPTRPRLLEDTAGDVDDDIRFSVGHTRSPTIPIRTVSSSHRSRPSLSISRSPSSPPGSSSALFSPISARSPVTASVTASVSTAASNTLGSLSRTIRNYTSFNPIPIGNAVPYPPQVSRPVSFGRFSGVQEGTGGRVEQEYEREYERDEYHRYDDGRWGEGEGTGTGTGYGYTPSNPPIRTPVVPNTPVVPDRQGAWRNQQARLLQERERASGGKPVGAPLVQHRPSRSLGSVLPEEVGVNSSSGLSQTLRGHNRDGFDYPSASGDDVDSVSWSRWDSVGSGKAKRTLLILGYTAGIQIWDTTNLGSVKEVLNLNFNTLAVDATLSSSLSASLFEDAEEWRNSRVVAGAVIPAAPTASRRGSGKKGQDGHQEEGPLLGLLLRPVVTPPMDSPRSKFVVYSLKSHQVVEKLEVSGLGERFECNEKFIVISTSSPPTLHIASATSLQVLHSISSSSLASYAPPPPTMASSTSYPPTNTSVPLAGQPKLHLLSTSDTPNVQLPRPVFALSGRLLVYATPPSNTGYSTLAARRGSSGSSTGSGPSPSSFSSTGGFQGRHQGTGGSPSNAFALPNISELTRSVQGRIPTTQAELGSAALKVGGSVLSGMRFLGGKAVEAAKSRIGGGVDGGVGLGAGEGGGVRVSRSAPSDGAGSAGDGLGARNEERVRRRLSNLGLSPVDGDGHGPGPVQVVKGGGSLFALPQTKTRQERGSLVRVVDLSELLAPRSAGAKRELPSAGSSPVTVVEFIASRSQPIASLTFSADGCTLFAVPKDGQVTKVWSVKPAPSVLRSVAKGGGDDEGFGRGGDDGDAGGGNPNALGSATHLYDLRRGVTSGVIEGVEVLKDGLLVGVTTRNRTVHVFPVNPYGGKSDVASHVDGRVRNPGARPLPNKVHLHPIVRIRGSRTDAESNLPRELAPLAFAFVNQNDNVSLPPSLAPNLRPAGSSLPSASPRIASSALPPSSPKPSPRTRFGARSRHQDALLFDSADGTMYLERITMESRPKDGGAVATSFSSVSTSLTSGFASISSSLPGMGGAGPLSRSVSSSVSDRSGGMANLAKQHSERERQQGGVGGVKTEEGLELVGTCSVLATWNLVRGVGWNEIRVPISVEGGDIGRSDSKADDEFLAQAELTTYSSSHQVLPRTIYLSHQFSFYTLGEDYHALIRRYHLNVTGTKIEVRKDIPVQAFTSSGGADSNNELFLDGFGSPASPSRQIAGPRSSFDEPLASALAGDMDFARIQRSETVLPMYPNGVPARQSKSLIPSSIPIKGVGSVAAGLGDGVSGGLDRIRQGIRRQGARIGSRNSAVIDPGMPFEFEEEEADEFMAPRISTGPSQSAQRSLSNSIHTDLDDDVVGHVDEEIWGEGGWDTQDRQAIEDEEQFQTISKTVGPPSNLAEGRKGSTASITTSQPQSLTKSTQKKKSSSKRK
ncbi:hypothetical protein FA15DRAFT_697905 [Coprinopsis marcescibilis]|uniref:BCAS3 WD40 domain-containing protein n=1 Tax=Coprinopsis marcescibilis TaxID=230819 RepID=A0A5C3KFH2_COPMA|nr:hypothetical protein FA15DRAFT_697905 [Coprinopsis marcescibilis]